MPNLSTNFTRLVALIKKHAPDPKKVKLIAVTKNQPVSIINEALKLGITAIGENRIQEAQNKFPALNKKVEKHFIGHLQSNKVKLAVDLFDCIQSVDSLSLAKKLNLEAEKKSKIMPILLQVNISKDPAKFGFFSEELLSLCPLLSQLTHLQIQGLMTITRLTDQKEELRPDFQACKKLFDQIKRLSFPNWEFQVLSMGMSTDFEVALEEGSNMIRIGSFLFT